MPTFLLFTLVALMSLFQSPFAESKIIKASNATETSVCEKLKKTFDIYNSYVFAQQLGIGSTESFNGVMYRKIQENMEKHISANCNTTNAETLISDTESICSSSCMPLANQASPKDKKKAEVMASNCQAICKIDGSSKKYLLEGLSSRVPASTDCENPSKDSISNSVKWFKYIDPTKDSADQDKPILPR